MAEVRKISIEELHESIGFEEYEECICGHSWEAHAKPESKISWDVCSFECIACDCAEYRASSPQPDRKE